MNSKQLAFTMPIDGRMIQIAEKLSKQQRNKQKNREVYLNTLAVLAVNFYCQCMEIETELEKSYALDSIITPLMNTASLFIKHKGFLECRPVLPKERFCDIPPEVSSERIGYMVVEINEGDRQARILGFVESVENKQLSLNLLRPLQYFLVHLQKLSNTQIIEEEAEEYVFPNPVAQVSDGLIKLTQWFDGLFNSGWELSMARRIPQDNVNEKEEVEGAKIMRLMHLSEPVLLIIHQTRLSQSEIGIMLRLYPATESIFLLDGVKMALLDEEYNPIPQLEKQARASNWLQLKLRGNVGDKFSLRISYEEDSITEKFVI